MSKNSSPIGGYYPTSSNTSSNSSGTSSGTATQSPDPYAAYTYALGLQNALGIAATPYQPYEGQMVAGFTPSQIAAQTGFQNAVGMSTPYYTASQDLYNQGLNYQANSMLPTASNYYWQGAESAYNPMTPLSQQYFSQAIGAASPSNYNVEPYMNPYQQNVVDATMRQLEQTQKQALGQNTQQSVLRGSYGGSGQFLGRAEVARQQALSNAQTLAQLNANNYLNAQNQYNEQQKNQMQAYQAAGQQLGNLGYQNASLKTQALQNAAQGLGALGNSQQAQAISNIQGLASGMAGLGNQSQQSYLQALAALQQSGAQQQQLQQNQLANAYQQFLQAKAYPYQQASYLSGLASGLGPLLGATTTQNSSQSSSGTGAQLGMQPYQNQSGGGGIFGGLTSLLGLGLKAFMPGMKDGGRVTGRNHYASGGPAEDDSEDMDLGSEISQSSPYSSRRASQAAGLGSLIGQQPYASRGGNYATDALKLSKVIPSAKQVAQERLLGAISDAIRGTPDPNKAQAEYARQQSLAPVSHEITSSFFGAQEPSRSGLGGLGESRRSSRRDEPDEDTESSKKDSGGFGSLLSGVKDNLSSLLNTEDGDFFASGGRVYRAEGGAAAPQGLSPQNAADYVRDLYQTQFGRQGDQGGFNFWTDKLQSGAYDKDEVRRRFADAQEGRNKIEDFYQTVLNRDSDPGGLNYWKGRLGSDLSLEDVGKSITAATETASARSAQNQITTMFQGALGRDPNTSELKQWTESLNAGNPLSDLSKNLSMTPGAQSRLADIYQQNLGQGPDVPSRDKWTALMAQGTPLNSIEDAIKSSPEAREYNRTHPGIVGDPARRSPKTIDALMETPESIAFNKKMNPTGRSGAGFEALMAQAYGNGPGPQYSPVQQGLQGMPDQSYYTKPLPNYLQQSALASYPGTVTGADGKPVQAPLGYLAISKTAADQDPAAFVKNIYGRYTGAGPTEDQLTKAADAIKGGTTRESIETDLAKTTPAQNQAFVSQLYNRTFGRAPDAAGLKFWTEQLAQGMPASSVASYFAKSPEQQSTSVVQGYMPQIADTRINPYTGLANLNYTAPYKSQPVPFAPGYKKGGRVGRARGGSLSSRERLEMAAKAALQAGASPQQAAMMAAIAMPESGGNPYAHNPNARTGDNSYGLWQVNMLGGMGPERRKQFGLSRNEELFDPVTNARAALKLMQGRGGLGNWSTYRHGSHKPYYSAAVDVVNNLVKDPSAVMAKIEAPAPLSLPTRGGEPSGSSIMYSAPRSQGTGIAEGSNPAQEKKGLRLSELIEDIIQPSLTQEGGSEQPKLATATPAPIIQLAEPMPIGLPLGNLGEENRGRYLDTVIAMNQRARGGRLHFANGGTDDESRERFYREQLEGSAPQYDPEAGANTFDRAAELGLNLASILPAGKAIKPLQTAYKTGKGIINAIRNMRGLTGAEGSAAEPGFGALEYQPRAPRGRQPSPGGEPIPAGLSVPKEGMSKFESNTEAMRRPGVPGREIYYWSSLRNPQGNRPMNRFEENQANLNWNRFGQYEPNKAPAYYDKYGNVAPPKVNYNGQSQRPISEFEANQGYFTQGIPGRDTRINSVARGPVARGFGTRDMGFTPAELGQELVPMGPRGMSVPPSRLPAGRSNLPTLATGSRGGGSGEPPIYADYRDVTGNILNGPRGGLVPSTGGGGNLVPPGGGGRPPRNFRTKTATTMMAPPGPPPGSPPNLPPFNPNITSDMATPKLTEYYKVNPALSAQDTPRAKRARPARKAAPQDDRRYWGDWRDTAGFNEDPIGNFLDNLTGDRKVARKPGTINSPMSPYAGDRFAYGGRAYRGEGGLLGGLGDALSTGISNLRSSKRSPISEGLITAGLGMMASPQHNPLRAIGEGGLLGIQAYNTASEQDREERKRLEQQKIDADFAQSTLEKLKLIQPDSDPKLFPNPSVSPIVRRRGGAVRRGYAQGGQPQQDEGFDPFEAIGAVGDTIGSGLQSLGDTIGNALMPSAQAQESEPAQARAPRKSSRSPIADGLITAGLGMMASPAHNPLRAIGEGGLRGVQAYNTAAEEQRKEDKLEEERLANENFTKSLTPKAPSVPKIEKVAAQEPPVIEKVAAQETPVIEKVASPTAPNPVVAQDQPTLDPVQQARREYDVLLSANPTNKWQRDWVNQRLRAAQFKLRFALDEQKQAGKDAEGADKTSGLKKGSDKAAEEGGTLAQTIAKGAASARDKISEYGSMHKAIREGQLSTGIFGPASLTTNRIIGGLRGPGSDESKAAALQESLEKISVAQTLDAFGGRLSTGVTNEDRDAIAKMQVSLSRTPEFNLAQLETAYNASQRVLAANKWTQEYIKKHGGIDANYQTAYADWMSSQPETVSPLMRRMIDDYKKNDSSQPSKGPSSNMLPKGYTYTDPDTGKKWRTKQEGSRSDKDNWEEVQ